MMVKNEPRKTQKLIIPQGTIDSMDTTIIEIPLKLQGQPVVIAKKKDSQKSIAFEDDDRGAYSSMGATHDSTSRSSKYPNFAPKYSSSERGYSTRGDTTFLVSRGENPPGESFEDETARFSSGRSQSRKSDATFVFQRTANPPGGITFEEEKFEPTSTFATGPSRTMAPRASQISGRYNFQTNIPSQAFRITCDIDDEAAEVDEIEQAERSLILGELQKYHDARRKYLMSFCEREPPPPKCQKRPSHTCRPCDAPTPTPTPSRCPAHHKTTSATSVGVGCDPCLKARAAPPEPEDGAAGGSKQGEGLAGEGRCIPTILSTSELQRIRHQFQEATRKLEKAMACMPCGSHSSGRIS